MDNIEQLKQDNAKLQERLNNAAKFFREQKAQIEALTKENEELKRTPKEEVIDTEKWNKLVTEKENLQKQSESLNEECQKLNIQCNEYELKLQKLENDIISKDTAYKVLQDTYNELYGENAKLKADIEKRVQNLRATENTASEELKKITTERDDLKIKYDEVFKASVDLGKEIAELKAKYKENDIARDSAELQLKNIQKEYTDKFNEQEKKLKWNAEEIEKLQSQIVKVESDNDILRKSDKSYREAVEQLKKENKEAEETAKNIMDSYENDIKQLKDENTALNIQLGEAEERYDKLNLQYAHCENEKLSIQADLDSLQAKYEKLEIQDQYNNEVADQYEKLLIQLKNIIDNTLDPKPEDKKNIMKRTGDYNVSGENIGV